MFKRNISFFVIWFVIPTIYQFIFYDEIQWLNNLGLSICVYIFYVLWEWLQNPYKKQSPKNAYKCIGVIYC